MRLVLGHLSSFGGQWFCPGYGIGCDFRVAQGWDKSSPFKVGDKGPQITEICSWEFCELYHSAPFHFQPASTCTSKRLPRTRMADCLLFIVPQLGLARLPSHLALVQGARYCHASRDDPERLGRVLS